jgi:hypothetical protein
LCGKKVKGLISQTFINKEQNEESAKEKTEKPATESQIEAQPSKKNVAHQKILLDAQLQRIPTSRKDLQMWQKKPCTPLPMLRPCKL